MQFIREYKLLEKIRHRFHSTLYRAQKGGWNDPVNIELINAAKASPLEIARLKHEYEKISSLKDQHLVEIYDIFDFQDSIAIVSEAFPGKPLHTVFTPAKIDLSSFIQLAVTIARTLGKIHSHFIVHQSISPDTVMFDESADLLKITGFGASGLITRIHEHIYDPFVIKSVLPYLAPEQTGWMNCSVDHRADLYALGILLYELLTGDVPFPSEDPVEIIHSHIAVLPPAPVKQNPAIPQAVSDIVMKLLSKTAEDRFQNGYGVTADLLECARQLEKNGEIQTFDLGSHDIAPHLHIPEHLFGREQEKKLLLDGFEQSSRGGNELFLVAGPPGIGKSALIKEIQTTVMAKRAYFISGKADPYKRDIPYYPIIQAFEDLVQKILCEPDEQIKQWKADILSAVGASGRLITDLVPEFEHIIGRQPTLVPIGTEVAHYRINYIFKEFLKVCATRQHPMVIFSDDLQWADAASLGFIRMLSTEPEIKYLFIIAAYRDTDVSENHLLIRMVNEAKKNGASITTISLSPLSANHVKQMIPYPVKTGESESLPLSEIIHRKTGGNPFFIRQFLKTLYEENALTLDPESGWIWNKDKIAEIRVTDNVVEFMASRIASMPAATMDILKVCACYGNRFNLAVVAAILGRSLEETVAELANTVEKGMIFFKAESGIFTHDRIREGVYQLFTKDERIRTHLTIGSYLLDHCPENQLEEEVVDIVNHFNIARELISSTEEQIRTARLNRLAGEKAMNSGAFESAFHFCESGIELMTTESSDADADTWETDYELMLALHNGAAEAAYLVNDYDEMFRLTRNIFNHCRTIHDSINAHIVLLHTLMAQNKLNHVIRSGLSVLNSLDVSFPGHPGKPYILSELIRTKFYIKGKKPEDFLKLPVLTDPKIQAQVDIMATITSAAYWTTPNLLPLILFRLVRIFTKHGNSDFSPYVYAGYGFILCTLGDIDTGYRYGQMALTLLEQLNAVKYRARTLFVVNTLVRHWKEHGENAMEKIMTAYHNGMEHGDIEFAGHALMVRGNTMYLLGTPLDEVHIELQKNGKRLLRLNQVSDLLVTRIFQQTVHNLRDEEGEAVSLTGKFYNETVMLATHENANDQTALFHLFFHKVVLSYLFEDYSAAFEASQRMTAFNTGIVGALIYAVSFFYDSLAGLGYYPQAGRLLKQKILFQVARNQKKMKKWADHSPENFLHKYYLVEAELSRIKGYDKTAIGFYKKAIDGARQHRYFQEAALACECLAGFYLDHDIKDFAAGYMAEAIELYERWGAHAKVTHLRNKHETLLARHKALTHKDGSVPDALHKGKELTDIVALIKISQAISSEIQLDKLLVILMRLIMENSGAEKAMLILNRDDRLVIDAMAHANIDEIYVLQSIPVDESPDLCPGIVNYAKRTGAPLVLDDALENNRFSDNPYIRENQIRSILCVPLIRQQRTIGLLYLENNLTPNTFTPRRLEIITLLSTQTASCLENAIFFEATLAAEKQAQKQREQYQKLVETMNDGLAIIDQQLHVTFVNRALCRMTGYDSDEIIGQPAIDFLDEKNQEKLETEVANWEDLERHIFEIEWTAKDGRTISTIVSPKPIYDDNGNFIGFFGIVTDVSDLKKAEREKELAQAQLLQSQKLEAIGTLAGGIAHDFNNYLTSIIGSVDLIKMKNHLPAGLKKNIDNIKHAAELSAALTRQLLAFGRVQMLEMTAINLNTVVANIEMMLKRLIGENIHLITRLAPDVKQVKADFGQMEQVIMNLAVNARDAMPDGGNLYLKTDNIVMDQAFAEKISGATPGEFVRLTVEDTGSGMDRETVERIFDPFFSSKAPGQGTGLGLSVVYGVIKQHQGWINVYSEPKKGTSFNIYLPVSAEAASPDNTADNEANETVSRLYPGKSRRILLVEDQPEVREVIHIALTENGYVVREAATIAEAEKLIEQEDEIFDLLFSDVILPDGNGIDFAGKINRRNPGIKVLLSSGYTEEKSRTDAIAQKNFQFLQKPYPLHEMLEVVHNLLHS